MPEIISIVDADPDLGDLLEPGELERARREALTRVQELSPGEWDAAAALEPAVHHRGFLIVDGLLSRTVDVLGRHCVELVGLGDVMRPWRWDDEGSHVRAEVGWSVLEPSRLAVLDNELVRAIMPWPQLGLELFNRGTRRAHHLAIALAIAHHQRLADLIGAHRQSVTTALGGLTRSGAISRRANGDWVLHGRPPAELRDHKLVAALS